MTMQQFVEMWLGRPHDNPLIWVPGSKNGKLGIEVQQLLAGQAPRVVGRVPVGMRRGLTPAQADRAGLRLSPEQWAQVFSRTRNVLWQMAWVADSLLVLEEREGGYDPAIRSERRRLEHELTEALPFPSPAGELEYAVDPDEIREHSGKFPPPQKHRGKQTLRR